ncbi:MAG: glycine--tRNA ligase [Candidatus Paceibacterota bacterium]
MKKQVTLETIISLSKRRGFIFQGSEIYGGLAGTWDYGPLGVELKNNIKQNWWKTFVTDRPDIYGIDAAIFMNPKTWEASGHVEGFNDPLVEDVKTRKRYRADHLLEEHGVHKADEFSVEEMTSKIKELGLKSPEGNEFGEVKQFNMMLKTRFGASEATAIDVYLRPETAQGIFVNYKNVIDSLHPKLPFGIAQIGKAFRNEITPRDFLFRLREFEQMEIQYFIHPDDQKESYEKWKKSAWKWLVSLGLPEEKMQWHDHAENERAHYAADAADIQFKFPFGFKELHGVHNRTDFDLKAHMEKTGVDLYYSVEGGEKFIPYVIESSVGLDRIILAILCAAYAEDEVNGEERVFLQLSPEIAPVKVAVFPLLKNKEELVEKAREVYENLRKEVSGVMWDDNGNIGKRYRRQDEIGTPFCVTVDFDTLEDNSVTLRDRDSAKQERVSVGDLAHHIKEKL